MATDSILAIIPARGGSKGIPRKNLRLLAGKPLVAHSIEHARQARRVSRVVVSTDDPEIAAVSEQYGAEVVWRPAELATDTAPSESALRHVLDYLDENEGYQPDLVVFLQATSPCRLPQDIDGAVQTLLERQADSVFSACAEHFTGRWRVNPDGTALPLNFEPGRRPRRQEYPIEYLENGSIYVFRPWVLRQTGNRMGGKIAIYEMPALRSFQVDELAELQFMEQLLAVQSSGSEQRGLEAVRLLVLDFDGVMTDNRVLVDQEGTEAVWCHRGDGWGVARLKEAGLEALVLSTETNPVVAARCRKLGLECIQGCHDKLSALQAIARQRSLEWEQIAYLGNDVNDLACLRWVGAPMAVADAWPEVRAAARLVTRRPGGQGAVREVVDWILEAQSRK